MQEIEDSRRALETEERNRIFQRCMHEDDIFNSRLNFFLLFESFLIAATATIAAAHPRPQRVVFIGMAVFGIAITVLWVYAQHRQLTLLRAIVNDLEKFATEVVRARIKARGEEDRMPHIGSVLAYAVPACLVILWLAVILATLTGAL